MQGAGEPGSIPGERKIDDRISARGSLAESPLAMQNVGPFDSLAVCHAYNVEATGSNPVGPCFLWTTRGYGETVSHETSDLNFGFRLPVALVRPSRMV